MVCKASIARAGLLAFAALSSGATSQAQTQDPAAGLFRALNRAIEASKAQQGQLPAQPPGGLGAAPGQQPAVVLAVPQAQLTAPRDEAKAIYDKAKAEGKSDEEAWIYQELSRDVRQLHEAVSTPTQLAFKNLRIGAEFPLNIGGSGAPSSTGRNVVSVQEGSAPEMNRVPPRHGPVEGWRCWTQPWGFAIECVLQESPDLTTAFGERLKHVEVILTKPQYDYQPRRYPWQKDMHPRIAVVNIVADGQALAKAANEYASGQFKSQPRVVRPKNENGATPTRASCASVNAKRVADLTTDDLALRRACANPTTALFQAMETPETVYKYENAGVTVDVVERKLIDGTIQSSMTLGSTPFAKQSEARAERVRALRAQYAESRSKSGRKDF